MYLDARDSKPPSLLQRPRRDVKGVLVGLLTALVAHALIPLSVFVSAALVAKFGTPDAKKTEPPVRHIVEARFVKLGKPLDPRKLPNRQVPRLSTAPKDEKVVSKKLSQTVPPDAGPRPQNAVEDLMTRVGDRAQAFAEISKNTEAEGNPDGVADGTDTTGQAGDIYVGKLVTFIRQGWSTPTLIPEPELRKLVVDVDVYVTPDGRVGRYQIHQSSGNATFDQSVLNRLEQLKASGEALPQPPAEVASDFLGKTLGMRFSGRDAR